MKLANLINLCTTYAQVSKPYHSSA